MHQLGEWLRKSTRNWWGGGLALVVTLAMSAPAALAQPVAAFSDQTLGAGLAFEHAPLPDTPMALMVGGGTVGDFNNDGWPDVFVIGGGGTTDRLYINQGNGTFIDQAASWGVAKLHRGQGATVGDFNHDGWIDLYVTSLGDVPGAPNNHDHKLYRNNGDGTFTDIADAAGVNMTAPYPDGYGATFGDIDLDGDLDLWVGGWFLDAQQQSHGNRLFRNNGDETFTDITVAAGVFDNKVHGFGALLADMDGDRYPELMIAGDFGTTRYYVNNRNGTFSPGGSLTPPGDIAWNGMGTTLGDFNGDGRQDWYVTAIYPAFRFEGPDGCRLYMNDGNHSYRSLPDSSGVNDGEWGWGTTALDFNHDGLLDIAEINGFPECDPVTGHCFTGDPGKLFQNLGGETFTDVSQAVGFIHTLQGRALMRLDYDQDGDMDLLALSAGDDLKLFRNDLSGTQINWLEVKLDSSAHPDLPPNGWGANIQLFSGNVSQSQRVTGDSTYVGCSEQIAHFGFGNATDAQMVVTWADGFRTVLDVQANQRITVQAQPPLEVDQPVPGQMANLTVRGAMPGETVTFGYSKTKGDGPCIPAYGGMCVGLTGSISLMGTAVADANGTAVLSVMVPANAPAGTYHMQGIIQRGPGGAHSLKTNVVSSVIP